MKLHFLFLQALVLCYVQSAITVDPSHQRAEQLDKVPDGWSRGDRPLSSKLIKFRLAINQHNAGEF